jgi:LuxR family maltose regulon positive regulatory protein
LIVSTKLRIPRVRNTLVARPRLMHKLDEGMDAKLTLVSAQAGYGKTTALSEWVRRSDSQVAWVSLDKYDNDWVQFWSYVKASIQKSIHSFGSTVEPLLVNGPSKIVEPAIVALLNELNNLTSELVIVLDDFHVIETPTIHQSIVYLLEHLPPHVHLYIASRTDLTIPTTRLLAKGELRRIIMQDLRFQLDEGFEFFRDTTDLLLTNVQMTELFDQTEGWISGLQLAAISLKSSNNITVTIQQFKGQQHHIADYLLEEVFHQLPDSIRTFLVETSILNWMNHSLCQAVTGQLNSQEQLERLMHMNLFITPLDDLKNWYRYHQLLSDFLQQILFKTDPDKWLQVHIRAAKWLELHGYDEEAVEHYLEGKQYEDAVRLMEKNLHKLVQFKSVVLIKWVSVLPENSFAEKPMLELFYIAVLLGVEEWEAAFKRVELAEPRFQALQGKMKDTEWNQVMGNLYFFFSITAYLQKDLDRTSAYFERVEQYVPEGSFFQTMGRNRSQGNNVFDDHLAIINDLHAAEVFLLKWITAWQDKQEYPFIGYLYASYSKLLYEWNRLDEAEFYSSHVFARKDMEPFARILIPNYFSASRVQQAKGNSNQASEILVQLKEQIKSPDYSSFMFRVEVEQACLSLQQGSLQEALDWMNNSELAHTDEITLNQVEEYLALAKVLVACERTDEAFYLLERLNRLLTKEERLRDRIRVIIVQTMAFQLVGQMESAHLYLETALQLAEPEGYIRSFIDEGPKMGELLATYSKVQKDSPFTKPKVSLAYVTQLLQILNGTSEEKQSLKEILTEQEMKVLHLIGSGLSNKEIALSLFVTGDTVKFHIKNVYRKLGVNNRVQALQYAQEIII